MSLALVLICGKLGAIIATYISLPPIVGFLLAGLAIQNVLNPMFIKGAGKYYIMQAFFICMYVHYVSVLLR